MPKFVFNADLLEWRHLEFRAIDLSTLGAISAAGFSTSPTSGTIAGASFTAPPLGDAGTFHAFIGSSTQPAGAFPPAWTFTARNVPNAAATSGRGTNDQGDLVGWSRNKNGAIHPFVWRSGAPIPIAFDIPGAIFPNDSTLHNGALDINNAGFVAGMYAKRDASGFHHAGFVANAYAPQGLADFVEVDAHMLEATAVIVRGTNSWQDVVGRYESLGAGAPKISGFVSTDAANGYADCRSVEIPGADQTVVGGINDSRQIVGYFTVGLQRHGFIWAVDNSGAPIGQHTTIDYPGSTSTRLDHIDNYGLMIGTTGPNTLFMPFVCWYSYIDFLESLLALSHLAMVQRVSRDVAAGGPGWVTPFGGWPHPAPPPLPYRESGQEALMALRLRELAGSLGAGEARDTIQKILRDYAMQQLHK